MGGTSPAAQERPWATLADTIKGIRAELSEAMSAGEDEQLRFDVGPVELEFAVDVQRDLSAKAGVKVWVVEIGATGARSRDSSHRVKVTLNPMDTTTGKSARIGDQTWSPPSRRTRRGV